MRERLRERLRLPSAPRSAALNKEGRSEYTDLPTQPALRDAPAAAARQRRGTASTALILIVLRVSAASFAFSFACDAVAAVPYHFKPLLCLFKSIRCIV